MPLHSKFEEFPGYVKIVIPVWLENQSKSIIKDLEALGYEDVSFNNTAYKDFKSLLVTSNSERDLCEDDVAVIVGICEKYVSVEV